MNVRDEILGKLKSAPKQDISTKTRMPPLNELSFDKEEMIEKFIQEQTEQTSAVHRVKDGSAVLKKLSEIIKEEGLHKVMVSTDDVVAPLDLVSWGKENDVQVFTAQDFKDRKDFTDSVFDSVEAGITGADYAVAETGTIGIIHDKNQPRLVSIAPIMQITIVPVERMVQVYEQVTDKVFGQKEVPSHFTFTTGPSMTADIQATAFKGMHGPRRMIIILVG